MSESAGASGRGVVDGGSAHRFTPIWQATEVGTRGIEIGPFLNPMVAKRDGYQTLVVDRYDQESLRARAARRGRRSTSSSRSTSSATPPVSSIFSPTPFASFAIAKICSSPAVS